MIDGRAAPLPTRRTIGPQPGPQTAFLASSADIAIFGGAAGGGKSYALLLEGTRHTPNPLFRAIYFRRTSPELRAPGGLWDESHGLFELLGGTARDALLEWTFPSGARIKFSHLERDSTRFAHQGAQYALIAFDEVNHFTAAQFWYLVGRLRSVSGVRPYLRATCNPDPDSWIAEFVSWWIGEDGYAIPERAGVLRWFARDGDRLVWGSTPEEVRELAPGLFEDGEDPAAVCMSATFIPAKLDDNPALLAKDPRYRAKLRALSYVDRMRLEGGNWKIRATAGTVFREEWFELVDAPAGEGARRVRFWDLAGSDRRRSDFSAGVLEALEDGVFTVEDVQRIKARPLETEELLVRTAHKDGKRVEIWIEQEAGAGAALYIDHLKRKLPGFLVRGVTVTQAGGKVHRAKAASSAAESGLVRVVRGPWSRTFLEELVAFPDQKANDQTDAFVGAFNKLSEAPFAWASV